MLLLYFIIDFCFAEHTERLATASKMRKQIEDTFGKMSGANDELAKLLEDEKKSELESEVNIKIVWKMALFRGIHYILEFVGFWTRMILILNKEQCPPW